jgi:hypothetical protein
MYLAPSHVCSIIAVGSLIVTVIPSYIILYHLLYTARSSIPFPIQQCMYVQFWSSRKGKNHRSSPPPPTPASYLYRDLLLVTCADPSTACSFLSHLPFASLEVPWGPWRLLIPLEVPLMSPRGPLWRPTPWRSYWWNPEVPPGGEFPLQVPLVAPCVAALGRVHKVLVNFLHFSCSSGGRPWTGHAPPPAPPSTAHCPLHSVHPWNFCPAPCYADGSTRLLCPLPFLGLRPRPAYCSTQPGVPGSLALHSSVDCQNFSIYFFTDLHRHFPTILG